MSSKIRLGVLGLGRIGKMHIKNIVTMDEFEILRGCDPFLSPETETEMTALGVKQCSKDPEDIFSDKDIDAVVICSTTDTHSDFIIRAAKSGKDIFCEKPIDHDVGRILEALKAVKEANVILQVGFMRRFDRHHAKVRKYVKDGKIGDLELLKISSRDPEPPTMKYVSESGGIFVDAMIHDFDQARAITGCEVTEVFATGVSVCDPEISKYDDFGCASAILKFENGAMGILEYSRRGTFGHDQRVEVMGSKGCAVDDNVYEDNVKFYDKSGCHSSDILWFFPERYKEAYFDELTCFAKAVINRTEPPVNGWDGLQAVLVAEAAAKSAKSGKMEKVEKIVL